MRIFWFIPLKLLEVSSKGKTVFFQKPLEFYPRLLYSSDKERNNWIITGLGEGIHWPDIDEDISLTNLINRSPSGESKSSFEKWNSGRKR
jgi:hypothetical protein